MTYDDWATDRFKEFQKTFKGYVTLRFDNYCGTNWFTVHIDLPSDCMRFQIVLGMEEWSKNKESGRMELWSYRLSDLQRSISEHAEPLNKAVELLKREIEGR